MKKERRKIVAVTLIVSLFIIFTISIICLNLASAENYNLPSPPPSPSLSGNNSNYSSSGNLGSSASAGNPDINDADEEDTGESSDFLERGFFKELTDDKKIAIVITSIALIIIIIGIVFAYLYIKNAR
jgi:hypothetical protein